MKYIKYLLLIMMVTLFGGCASTTAHRAPTHNRVIVIYEDPVYYPMYTSWRIGYDWGFGPRYMGHGNWRGRR